MRYIALRYFNAAGATERNAERHQPETHLIPRLLQAAWDTEREIAIFGNDYSTRDGTCVRDYIHVVDLARAHTLALRALFVGDKAGRSYNVGCGGPAYTVVEVVDAVQRVTGRKIRRSFGPRRRGDPPVLVASPECITRELGWRAERQDLHLIIESAWRWMLQRMS